MRVYRVSPKNTTRMGLVLPYLKSTTVKNQLVLGRYRAAVMRCLRSKHTEEGFAPQRRNFVWAEPFCVQTQPKMSTKTAFNSIAVTIAK